MNEPEDNDDQPKPVNPIPQAAPAKVKRGINPLGVAALTLGIVACLSGWTLLNFLAIPFALVGFLLAFAGIVLAAANKKTGFVSPICGMLACFLAVALSQVAGEEWSRSLTVRQGDVQVSVIRSYISGGFDSPAVLDVTVEVKNLSSTQKMDFSTWHPNSAVDYSDYARLTDNYGNAYKAYSDTLPQSPISIYPGGDYQQDEFFETPVENIQWLHLELPAKNFGGQGMLRFEIPATSIAKSLRQAIEWREQRESQQRRAAETKAQAEEERQAAAAAKAQAEAHWRALPDLARAQVATYQSNLLDVAAAESQVQVCQTNVSVAEQAFENEQQKHHQAKTNYDQFMATNPVLTNEAYVKIQKDLAYRKGRIAGLMQVIENLKENLNQEQEKARRQSKPWISNNRTDPVLIASMQANQTYLANAKTDLDNTYARIDADQQVLDKMENDVNNFQANKLHDAESPLNAARNRLTDARSSLDAAKHRLDECKRQAASSLDAANSVLEEYRTSKLPGSK